MVATSSRIPGKHRATAAKVTNNMAVSSRTEEVASCNAATAAGSTGLAVSCTTRSFELSPVDNLIGKGL